MPITFDAQSRTFHLRNEQVSYLIRVLENGTLGHLYFGGPLAADGSYAHLSSREFLGFSNRLGEPVALEYPTSGIGDYRVPALVVGLPDGSNVQDLRFVSHRIFPGKPAIPGLPSTYLRRTPRRRRSRSSSPIRPPSWRSTSSTPSSRTCP